MKLTKLEIKDQESEQVEYDFHLVCVACEQRVESTDAKVSSQKKKRKNHYNVPTGIVDYCGRGGNQDVSVCQEPV